MKRIPTLLCASLCVIIAEAQNEGDGIRRTTKLPEVTVRLKPVEQVGDTIKYNVSAFQGKDDHYLEDVLKKMPGIQVSPNGTILYKGETINQFNIEGQNLLGNRYSQATRNLPVEAISQVQVMENDQPIRALKSTVPSDRATLNIKLKSGYKMRPFGELEGGAGYGEDATWNNHLSVINIAAKNQLLLTAKMNNTGEDLSGNAVSNNINVSDLEGYVALPRNSVNAMETIFSPIPQQRYLKNKSYSVGFNHMHRVGRYGGLRTNIDLYSTADNLADSTYYLYGGAHTATLSQSNRIKVGEKTIAPKFRYELNAPKVYLLDQLSASLSYHTGQNDIYSNGRQVGQQVTRHPSYVQNKLAMTISSGLHTYNIGSTLFYFRRSETLAATDAGGVYDIRERIGFNRFKTANSISTSFPLFGNILDLRYEFSYLSDRVRIDAADDNDNSSLLNTIAPSYTMRYSKDILVLDCPINHYAAKIPWRSGGRHVNRTYLSPSVRWNHNFSPQWRLTIAGAIQQSADDDVITPQAYRSDYRTLTATPDRMGWARSSNASLKINYGDFVNMFTWNLLATMSWRHSDWRFAYDISNDLTKLTPLWQSATTRYLMAQTRVEKTFTQVHVAIQGTVSYSRNELPVVQNGLQQRVVSNVATSCLLVRWYNLSWLQVTNESTFNLSWQDRYANSNSQTLKSLFNDFSLVLSPLSRLSLTVSCDYSLLETSKGEYNSILFADAKLLYTPSKRWELGLRIDNALNRKQYVDASFTGFNYRYFSLPLRGREAMVTVKYKF